MTATQLKAINNVSNIYCKNMVILQKNNRFYKSINTPILGEVPNDSKQSQKPVEPHIEIHFITPNYPRLPYTPTAYDYLALVPSVLIAATPLILGWFDRRNKTEDKKK